MASAHERPAGLWHGEWHALPSLFGLASGALREARGISLKEMAAALNVSSAYLSALEHGRRGQPTSFLLHRIIAFFNVIWDEAEELQRLTGVPLKRMLTAA